MTLLIGIQRTRRSITEMRLHFAKPHVAGFKAWLEARNYTSGTISGMVPLLGHWTEWMHKAGFDLDTIHAGHDASARVLRGRRATDVWLRAGALFIQCLEELREVSVRPQLPLPTEVWPILGIFEDWMRMHHGVTEQTLFIYRRVGIIPFLEQLGDNPQAYSVQAVRNFVLERARSYGRSSSKLVATATRAFLRYLAVTGQCSTGLEHAILGFSGSSPKPASFLGQEDIERLLASCQGKNELRDRAIILLLARIGLRASEAAHLQFSDIDWAGGRLAVAGKSRRASLLPLAQEVGDALIAHPSAPIFGDATNIPAELRTLCRHAGLFCAKPRGPRHKAVWNQNSPQRFSCPAPLRGNHHAAAGRQLGGIGAVLRHRSIRMTMHYAKVDFELLSEIAQPWAGEAAC